MIVFFSLPPAAARPVPPPPPPTRSTEPRPPPCPPSSPVESRPARGCLQPGSRSLPFKGLGGDARDSKLERLNSSTKRFHQMATFPHHHVKFCDVCSVSAKEVLGRKDRSDLYQDNLPASILSPVSPTNFSGAPVYLTPHISAISSLLTVPELSLFLSRSQT